MATGDDMSNPAKKVFVLCFDGTGNKFEGKDTDSNILKIYRLLDRSARDQFSFYNPGIGTYVNTSSLEHTGTIARFRSWYMKAKDSAIGTGLGDHVMSGYRFLMRYYSPEDDIYIFGFSRGAYTARFLAEMLDHVGLLSAGNEELQRFAWKCFSKYQARKGGNTQAEKDKAYEQYLFMKAFRETFSRPVRRIRFLGLFDTVNSVPRFEAAWMQRTKHPYTARSSAKVIRHAVSINERRAKFRQDLVAGSISTEDDDIMPNMMNATSLRPDTGIDQSRADGRAHSPAISAAPQISITGADDEHVRDPAQDKQHFSDALEHLFQPSAATRPPAKRESSYTAPVMSRSTEDFHYRANPQRRRLRRRFSGEKREQDILEVWFPGNHADIGGGWHKAPGENWALSHGPLVWMVHEAEKAGLKFDPEKMVSLMCCPDKIDEYGNKDTGHEQAFHDALHQSSTQGYIHDCLHFGGGLPATSTMSWRIMEYLPFRRMDLNEDGSWKPIRWPLPGGETRDIPANAKIHVSAIQRMKMDEKYRPGNLILMGKGGRGVKIAPKKAGTGDWEIFMNEGNPVSEIYINTKTKEAYKNGNESNNEE